MSRRNATPRRIAEVLFARHGVRDPGSFTSYDLDEAFDAAREANGNPLPVGGFGFGSRSYSGAPQSHRLTDDRADRVLAAYAALCAAKAVAS